MHLQNFEIELLNWEIILSETEGLLPIDLKRIAERTLLNSALESADDPIIITNESIMNAIKDSISIITPLITIKTSLKDIGGLNEAKSILLETLEWPTKYPSIFSQSKLRPRSG